MIEMKGGVVPIIGLVVWSPSMVWWCGPHHWFGVEMKGGVVPTIGLVVLVCVAKYPWRAT